MEEQPRPFRTEGVKDMLKFAGGDVRFCERRRGIGEA
jgi:hypothetical protein